MAETNKIGNGAFSYQGRQYRLDVRLIVPEEDGKTTKDVGLDSTQIEYITIISDINDLYLKGFINYVDKGGKISRISTRSGIKCQFTLQQLTEQKDGDTKQLVCNYKFEHTFIVESEGIIKRDGKKEQNIYTIRLRGEEYSKLQNSVSFENNSSDEKDDQKKHPHKIIRIILNSVALDTDDTFDNIGTSTTLDYITCANDTAQTSIDYLLSKMFFSSTNDAKESAVKFLLYDWITKKYQFREFGTPSGKDSRQDADVIIISQNKTDIERVSDEDYIDFEETITTTESDVIIGTSEIEVNRYDVKTNSFLKTTIPSQTIVNDVGGKFGDKTHRIKRSSSEWSDNLNVYKTLKDAVLGWNTFKINCVPRLERKLLDVVITSVDKRISLASLDSTREWTQIIKNYESIEGAWFITSLSFVIKPDPEEGSFRQSIRLSRPFNM